MKHSKRKVKINESALLESYVDFLIKESNRRVLNEKELLTLIGYTESGFLSDLGRRAWGATVGPNGALQNGIDGLKNFSQRMGWSGQNPDLGPRIVSATRTATVPSGNRKERRANKNSIDQTFIPGKDAGSNRYNYDRVGTDNSHIVYAPNRLAQAADVIDNTAHRIKQGAQWLGDAGLSATVLGINKALAAKDNLQKAGSAIRTGVRKTGDALRTGKELATSAWNSIPMQMARAGANAAGRGIKAGSIWAWDKLKSYLDQSARDSAELSRLGYGNTTPPSQRSYAPGPTTLSESTIVKRGKRIKQKQIMSDFQEQMLIDYLNSRTKKLSKRKK